MEFFNTHISDQAKINVNKVLDSTFISAGQVALEFELALEDQLGLINPVTVNSGTSAIHLALNVAGIGEGDEVITSPQTFVATGLAILMQRAKPIFADIQYDSGNINPNSIKEKITDKTKAILPVHWAGYPCDMNEINQIAKDYNLIVIEDAAHAIGATYQGRVIGSISDFTCFSFQAIKHITTGDGGALCCLNKNHYNEAKKKRWFGIDRQGAKQSNLGERIFDIDTVGFKYHMNDFSAALGLGNLEDFFEQKVKLQEMADYYYQELSNIHGLQLLDRKQDRESANWLFSILVQNRNDFIQMMNAKEIPVSVVHQRIDRFSVFGEQTQGLINQEKFDEQHIAIPLHSQLNDEDIIRIASNIKKGW